MRGTDMAAKPPPPVGTEEAGHSPRLLGYVPYGLDCAVDEPLVRFWTPKGGGLKIRCFTKVLIARGD